MRFLFLSFSVLLALLLLLPLLFVTSDAEAAAPSASPAPAMEETEETELPCADIPVYADDRTVLVSVGGAETALLLSDYLVGVLLGEIPMTFAEEARRAMAVAVRTYVLYREEHGMVLSDDSAVCCAYCGEAETKTRYGALSEDAAAVMRDAVRDTDGEILLYNGETAMTVFHAMSYEMTESAENLWGQAVPYLVSVTTPEDSALAGMQTTLTVPLAEVRTLLGMEDTESVLPVTVSQSPTGRVAAIQCGDRTLTGKNARTLFHLRSTRFSAEATEEGLVFTVWGYGHGVGMSEYGAHFLALAGLDYRAILLHYYQNCYLS